MIPLRIGVAEFHHVGRQGVELFQARLPRSEIGLFLLPRRFGETPEIDSCVVVVLKRKRPQREIGGPRHAACPKNRTFGAGPAAIDRLPDPSRPPSPAAPALEKRLRDHPASARSEALGEASNGSYPRF